MSPYPIAREHARSAARELSPRAALPCRRSALITVSNFARPGMLIEIRGIAVIGDNCSSAKPCSPR
jgi:hypothetical protein